MRSLYYETCSLFSDLILSCTMVSMSKKDSKSNYFDVVIIGGGAAGLMSAVSAIEINPEISILLIERNGELGKKVKISGGGRCNVTTGIQDIKTVLQKYPRGGKFLISAMHGFPPTSMMDWVESHGVPLKTEDDMRVFPVSDNSEDVVGIFEKILKQSNATVYLGASVERVKKQKEGFGITLRGNDTPVVSKRLIITTGGQAYRDTGSTGDGYAFAQSLGHSITPLAPSLSSLMTEEIWTADVSGVSFPYVVVSTKQPKASAEGGFIFTHKGISGPAVFALSSQIAFEEFDRNTPKEINIDLIPDQSKEELFKKLMLYIQENPKKQIVNILSYLIPKSLSDVVCYELRLIDHRRAVELSKKEHASIIEWIKAVPLHAVGRGAGDEFVTAGGVSLDEVNPKTMESKITKGLYFAGEVLNIDGYTGGFNLQASWATGRSAGISSSSPTPHTP